jgi:uracil-DNA glycosylase family 4
VPKVLLIDGNSFLWRAAHSSPMEFVANRVLTFFFEVLSRFSPEDMVVCWDKGKSRWRGELFEEYKAHRLQQKKDTELDLEALGEQSMLAYRYLNSVGVRQVLVPGLEADDVLAWLAEYYKAVLGWNVILSSGDRDLWQLVDDHLLVWDHQRQNLVTEQTVMEYFGVTPRHVAELKAFVGDPSDNLPGVKQVGEKTAATILRRYGSLGNVLDPANAKEMAKRKSTARILDEGDFVGEMYRLVKLPTLQEGARILSDEERVALETGLTEVLPRDALRSQVLAERIGASFLTNACALPAYPMDLRGMVTRMNLASPQSPSWASLHDVDLSISQCCACPLRQDCVPEGPTYPEGDSSKRIMIIGRNPGRQEKANCRPFYPEAPAGERLGKFLQDAGIWREECWVTNVCKCYSQDDRPPTYPEILACLPHLKAEIELIKPKLILAFGNEAMMAVTPYKSRVTKHCGELLENPTGLVGKIEAFVAISVHPSAALRSTQNGHDMDYASKVVRDFLAKRTMP